MSITKTHYPDIIAAIDALSEAARRVELAAEVVGPTEANYPILQSTGSRQGLWFLLHDAIKVMDAVVATVGGSYCARCNDNVEIC
jgi:hypothetical protein